MAYLRQIRQMEFDTKRIECCCSQQYWRLGFG